jgi:cell wall-associated NlpC family hydrolase
MKRFALFLLLFVSMTAGAPAQANQDSVSSVPEKPSFADGVRSTIQKYLGRRYVWGASGIKSFDCSGFVWRVMFENGILLKRTTARKFYMMLPPVAKEDQWNFGTVVFFDDLKHVGIVDTADAFYQAQVTIGTNRSPMNSFWRRKIYGFRRFPTAE